MRLALASPLTPSAFADHLHPDSAALARTLPGLGSPPVTLLARTLLDRGHRLTLLTLDPTVSHEIVLTGPSLRLCIGPYRPRRRHLDLFAAERAYLVHALERERPTFVHAHWTYEFAAAALDSRLPTLITAHDAPLRILAHHRDLYRLARTLLAVRVVTRAPLLTAVSPHVADHLRNALGHDRPIPITPCGLPASVFASHISRPRNSGGVLTLACVANGFDALKNTASALHAFAELQKERPACRLLLFGADHGPDGPAHAFARQFGLTPGVSFHGPVPHADLLARLASDVDLLLHPSFEESQSMAIAEAMALGLPVLAGEHSGAVPWTLDSGRAGALADVRSPRRLANALRALADDPARRASLAAAAQRSARDRFHIDSVADTFEHLYRRLAA